MASAAALVLLLAALFGLLGLGLALYMRAQPRPARVEAGDVAPTVPPALEPLPPHAPGDVAPTVPPALEPLPPHGPGAGDVAPTVPPALEPLPPHGPGAWPAPGEDGPEAAAPEHSAVEPASEDVHIGADEHVRRWCDKLRVVNTRARSRAVTAAVSAYRDLANQSQAPEGPRIHLFRRCAVRAAHEVFLENVDNEDITLEKLDQISRNFSEHGFEAFREAARGWEPFVASLNKLVEYFKFADSNSPGAGLEAVLTDADDMAAFFGSISQACMLARDRSNVDADVDADWGMLHDCFKDMHTTLAAFSLYLRELNETGVAVCHNAAALLDAYGYVVLVAKEAIARNLVLPRSPPASVSGGALTMAEFAKYAEDTLRAAEGLEGKLRAIAKIAHGHLLCTLHVEFLMACICQESPAAA